MCIFRTGYGDKESFRILLDGKPILASTHPGKSWELHLLHFVATSDKMTLRFENNSPKGDSTVFIDSVEGIGEVGFDVSPCWLHIMAEQKHRDIESCAHVGGGTCHTVLSLAVCCYLSNAGAHVCDNKKWTTEGDRCYRFFSQDGLSYQQMQAKCVQAGGELARVDNEKQATLVGKLAGKSRAFIGLTDAASEGHWMWADGTAPSYTNWAPGEPNDLTKIGGEDCAIINWNSPGKWNDGKCASNDYSEGYVCSAVVAAKSVAGKDTGDSGG